MNKRTTGEKIFAVFNTIFLLALCVIFLLPVWHVAMGSISDPLKVAATSGLYVKPLGTPTLGGYKLIFQNSNIITSYGNTIFYVVTSTLIGLVLNILAAYVMSRKGLLIGKPFSLFVLFTMIFNGGLIPTLVVVYNLGMIDTRWAVILPGAVASDFRILTQVVLPVSKAIIAVIILFYGVQHWNEWFNASIYLRDRKYFPLQLILREIVLTSTENSIVQDANAEDVMIYRPLIKYATIMVSIIPMMIIYPFVQKYFVSGVMIGAVKG